jgi:opacity protein-like surface antigen
MSARPLLAVAAAALLAPAARADAPAASGPYFGIHAGYGLPWGDVSGGGGPRIEDVVDWKVPIGIDLGYRFNRRFWGQLFFELAPASAATDLCAGGVKCTASDVRLGIGALLRLAPSALLDPWLGAGVAVEVLNAEGAGVALGATGEASWFGFELPFVEGGVDLAVSDRVTLGPWVSYTLARFTSESLKPDGGSTTSGRIHERANHGWLSAGLKATLKL